MTRLRFCAYLCGLLSLLSWPKDGWGDAGSTAGILLQQPFGGRPTALGQAYTALGDDVFGLSYNPAILSRLRDSQAATQFIQSIAGTQIGYAAFATPINPTQALGLSVSYLDAGKADIFDNAGTQINSVDAERDILVHLGYAHSFDTPFGKLHIGGAGKLLNSTIAEQVHATAYAADMGALHEFPNRFGLTSVGASLQNAGPSVAYSGGLASGSQSDPLPLTIRFGLGHTKKLFTSDSLSIGLGVDRVFYDNTVFEEFGLEYGYRSLFFFRFGYRAGQDLGALNMGVGFQFRNLSLDYAIALMQTFNNVQSLSLSYHFNIPGIRYNTATPPSSLETLSHSAQTDISSNHYFEASFELDRIEAFFPDSPDILRFRHQINEEINAILSQGSSNAHYLYALSFKAYQEKNWNSAVANLQASLKADPGNSEIKKYLEKSKKNLEENNNQAKLQQQARNGALFELANEAFDEGDMQRALKIVNEILRVGPYQPAQSLLERIQMVGKEPPPSPTTSSTPVEVSEGNKAQAEQLYYQAVRDYAENKLDEALKKLRQGLQLNPNDENIKSTLKHLKKFKSERPF